MKRKFSILCAAILLNSRLTAGSRANTNSSSHATRWNCEWEVHYDTWIPSFKTGEYRHGGPSGGAHCLDACCQDPACTGIQLESSEQFQCYEYVSPPQGLNAMTLGRRLGDGLWLRGLRPAWSVFTKADRKEVKEVIGLQPPPVSLLPSKVQEQRENYLAYESTHAHDSHAQMLEKALDQELSGMSETMGVSQQHCQWDVHYDKWMPTFVPGEYRREDEFGHPATHALCLDVCCQDPSCAGIQFLSNEESQCYKYTRPPDGLVASEGRNLGDGAWLRQKQARWSVFVKSATIPSWKMHLPGFQTTASVVSSVSRTGRTGSKISVAEAASQQDCEWVVHYDTWIPTFVPGEYEHNDAYGGAHCLVACCQDPTCVGLEMESSEKFQCYKYARPPVGLKASHGKPLADGKWLISQRQAWSIVLKVNNKEKQPGPRIRAKSPMRVQKLQHLLSQQRDNDHQVASTATRIGHCSSDCLNAVLITLLAGLSLIQ